VLWCLARIIDFFRAVVTSVMFLASLGIFRRIHFSNVSAQSRSLSLASERCAVLGSPPCSGLVRRRLCAFLRRVGRRRAQVSELVPSSAAWMIGWYLFVFRTYLDLVEHSFPFEQSFGLQGISKHACLTLEPPLR
jgi:hypothetical protein